MKTCIHSSAVSTLLALGLSFSSASGAWTEVAVGAGDSKVAIGEGRNDGITRVYSNSRYSWTTDMIKEFSWSGAAWSGIDIYRPSNQGDLPVTCGPAIGVARKDGVKRIYCGGGEHTYSSPNWNYSKAYGSLGQDLKLLTGRNDGINRLYVAGIDGFMHEYTWVPNTTSYSDLAMPSGASTVNKLACGNARNDGIQRLCGVTSQGELCEWTYSEGWSIVSSAFEIGQLFDIAIGSPRGDGINRLYLACADGHAYEVTWTGTAWSISSMGFGTLEMTAITLGEARNDGITRVIAGNADGRIYEFRFQNGSWSQNLVVQGSGRANGLTIGTGRGDGVNRLYVAQGKNLKEYTYTPTTSAPFAAQILPDGILEWSSTPGGVYDVEWSSDLTTWRSDWSTLTGIPATDTSTQKPIPRFFRVKQRTE